MCLLSFEFFDMMKFVASTDQTTSEMMMMMMMIVLREAHIAPLLRNHTYSKDTQLICDMLTVSLLLDTHFWRAYKFHSAVLVLVCVFSFLSFLLRLIFKSFAIKYDSHLYLNKFNKYACHSNFVYIR